MKFTLLVACISFPIFLFYPSLSLPRYVNYQEDWVWNKTLDLGLDKPKWGASPFERLNGYENEGKLYHFQNNSSRPSNENLWRTIPFFGKGVLEYKKIGDEVNFYNTYGEALWIKPYNSYPRSSPDGSLILWVSGDQNKVFFSDANGNSIGVGVIEGRYLTDYKFSEDSHVVLIFSGGEVFYLNEKAEILWKKVIEIPSELVFLKSVCLTPQGDDASRMVGIHLLKDTQDMIWFVNSKGEIEEKFNLDFVLPFTISFACQVDGSFAIAQKSSVQLYSANGKLHKEFPRKTPSSQLYSSLVALPNAWLWEREGVLEILDLKGNLWKQKIIGSDAKPWRIMPDTANRSFFLETQKEIWRFYEME